MAAADWFGRTAGESVKSESKEDAVRTRLFERGAEGLMDAIAWEVEVRDKARVISCFNFACRGFSSVRLKAGNAYLKSKHHQ